MNLNDGGDRDEINRKRKNVQGCQMNQNGDINKKRWNPDVEEIHQNRANGHADQNPNQTNIQQYFNDEEDRDFLDLSLRCGPREPSARPKNQRQSPPLAMMTSGPVMMTSGPVMMKSMALPRQPQSTAHHYEPQLVGSMWVDAARMEVHAAPAVVVDPERQPRAGGNGRRNAMRAQTAGKSGTIAAPYPWATTKRATVHSMVYLNAHETTTITGNVQCKRCDKQYQIGYNLREKFVEVCRFIVMNKEALCHRAPKVWTNPVLPNCRFCDQENCVKPLICEKKRGINWLFLLLGQTLGCCTLEQLKYFCKHTNNHRTGAKDRVLYLTYLALCKQLDPFGPFGP